MVAVIRACFISLVLNSLLFAVTCITRKGAFLNEDGNIVVPLNQDMYADIGSDLILSSSVDWSNAALKVNRTINDETSLVGCTEVPDFRCHVLTRVDGFLALAIDRIQETDDGAEYLWWLTSGEIIGMTSINVIYCNASQWNIKSWEGRITSIVCPVPVADAHEILFINTTDPEHPLYMSSSWVWNGKSERHISYDKFNRTAIEVHNYYMSLVINGTCTMTGRFILKTSDSKSNTYITSIELSVLENITVSMITKKQPSKLGDSAEIVCSVIPRDKTNFMYSWLVNDEVVQISDNISSHYDTLKLESVRNRDNVYQCQVTTLCGSYRSDRMMLSIGRSKDYPYQGHSEECGNNSDLYRAVVALVIAIVILFIFVILVIAVICIREKIRADLKNMLSDIWLSLLGWLRR